MAIIDLLVYCIQKAFNVGQNIIFPYYGPKLEYN